MRNGIQHKVNGNYLLKYSTRLLSLLPITTLFQGFSFLSPINQVIVAVSFVFLFILMFFAKYDRWQWFMLFAVGLLTVYNLSRTDLPFQNINMPIYLIYWVVMLIVAGQNMVILSDLLTRDYLWYRKIIYIYGIWLCSYRYHSHLHTKKMDILVLFLKILLDLPQLLCL